MKSLSAATRGLGNIKSIQRITAAMRVCVFPSGIGCSLADSVVVFQCYRLPGSSFGSVFKSYLLHFAIPCSPFSSGKSIILMLLEFSLVLMRL